MTTLAGITTIKDLPIENKRVFIRVDFNVPLEEQPDGTMVIISNGQAHIGQHVEAQVQSTVQTGAGVLPEPYTQARIVEESVKMAQVHDTFTLRPNLLNQFNYSVNRIWIPLQNPTLAGAYAQKAGAT